MWLRCSSCMPSGLPQRSKAGVVLQLRTQVSNARPGAPGLVYQGSEGQPQISRLRPACVDSPQDDKPMIVMAPGLMRCGGPRFRHL